MASKSSRCRNATARSRRRRSNPCRPCESRDPYAAAWRLAQGADGFCSNELRWLSVLAPLGTTWIIALSLSTTTVVVRLDRTIQYAAASRLFSGVSGILGRPVKPGDDG